MFEVLVFVYENYWRGDACPRREQLERKLCAAGFEAAEIDEALTWLGGLTLATSSIRLQDGVKTTDVPDEQAVAVLPQSAHAMRIYSVREQDRLGAECLGFIRFLESAEVLPAHMREIVVERALASITEGQQPLSLEDLKIIVLMVYWSFGEEPDALVLDELCDDASDRLAH